MAAAAYIAVAAALFSVLACPQGRAQPAESENYASWRLHKPTFPSTGGNGVIIGEYYPVIAGDKCTTDFTATLADGKVYYNTVEFDAVPAQGGILCTNGRWRARDGSASGTTPYRVFFKDGVLRGSP
jgi:hypothetical protein